MQWDQYDANGVDKNFIDNIKKRGLDRLLRLGIDITNQDKVNAYIVQAIKEHKQNISDDLNTIVSVHIFRPSEFDDVSEYDDSLKFLAETFIGFKVDFKNGSKIIQRFINDKFKTTGEKTIRGGRERVTLDSLVIVNNKTVAIEYETSTNIDNGYFSLREAVKAKMSEYGVMVVPWLPIDSGRAYEGIATGRLDRECEQIIEPIGPIYSLALVRWVDIYNEILKD